MRRSKTIFRNQVIKFFIIFVLFQSAPIFIFFMVIPPPAVGLTWDWANALGYIAASMILFLFLLPGYLNSFHQLSYKSINSLHRKMGFMVLIFVSLHVLMLLYQEKLLIEYLKLTAPIHILSGLLALFMLILLIISSLQTVRKVFHGNTSLFRYFHIVGGYLIVLLICYHITASGYYANTPWKQALWISGSLGVIIYSLITMKSSRHDITLHVQSWSDITFTVSNCGLIVLVTVAWLAALILNR